MILCLQLRRCCELPFVGQPKCRPGLCVGPDDLERAPVAERDLAQQCRGESLGADTTALRRGAVGAISAALSVL